MLIVGQGLSTFAFADRASRRCSPRRDRSARVATPRRFNDLGNLMLAFMMLWAYMSFSQYLIIWSGNLTEEIPWYLRRTAGGWQWIAARPDPVPLLRAVLRACCSARPSGGPASLLGVAAACSCMHFVDVSWLILPGRSTPQRPRTSPGLRRRLALLATVGIGGIWVAAFVWFLGRDGRDSSLDRARPSTTATGG